MTENGERRLIEGAISEARKYLESHRKSIPRLEEYIRTQETRLERLLHNIERPSEVS